MPGTLSLAASLLLATVACTPSTPPPAAMDLAPATDRTCFQPTNDPCLGGARCTTAQQDCPTDQCPAAAAAGVSPVCLGTRCFWSEGTPADPQGPLCFTQTKTTDPCLGATPCHVHADCVPALCHGGGFGYGLCLFGRCYWEDPPPN